mgnify:CR=1 FL=1
MSNTRVIWLHGDDPPERFPPIDAALAEPDGLLAAGGDLRPTRAVSSFPAISGYRDVSSRKSVQRRPRFA